MIRTLRNAIAAGLLLAAGNALALGLGQIEVKSRINQPLLAEIPIISTTPGELQALQARLASPETFRRVGLQPPRGIAADLRFSLGNDARGRPVIRVTTLAPVTQAVLNFLIEVDWGQGRLVREYSALVDAPRTASAPLQPAISVPVVAAPDVIRRPDPVPAGAGSVPPQASAAAPDPLVPAPVEPAPVPGGIPTMQSPAPVSATATLGSLPAAPAPAAAMKPSQYGPVKAGETLSEIAAELDRARAYSLDQTMLALLRANPDAFLGDNVNLLREGAVLRIPGNEERADIRADQAQQVVRQQMQQWRQARRPVLQPVAAADRRPPPGDAGKPIASAASRAATPARSVAGPTTATPAATPRLAPARLKIVPAASGKATGTRSGTSAGGEGSMLQQQLQQRDEDLAARKAEISDLKERVAELETLKQQQAQLLSMKDSELAAAQQRLAEARKEAAARPAAAASSTPPAASTQPSPPQPPAQATGFMPWLWGGLALIVLALLAWGLSRRRPAPRPTPVRRGFDSEALAASMRAPVPEEIGHESRSALAMDSDIVPAPAAPEAVLPPVIDSHADPASTRGPADAPAWHSGGMLQTRSRSSATAAAPVSAPAAASDQDGVAPGFIRTNQAPVAVAPDAEPPSAEQRMKLARAFLDIGDEHSARQLLVELKEGAADMLLRSEAARLLRDLG